MLLALTWRSPDLSPPCILPLQSFTRNRSKHDPLIVRHSTCYTVCPRPGRLPLFGSQHGDSPALVPQVLIKYSECRERTVAEWAVRHNSRNECFTPITVPSAISVPVGEREDESALTSDVFLVRGVYRAMPLSRSAEFPIPKFFSSED
ncbi:hypothetical protein A0H81_12127 [Grifola frondosa]|uniref:Uncharacterized protein n=1 Tax=Grifola frondosa TaxID=5627 RepID=A0A1C7LSY9_GRIFR|nr:hypothetical protein A0H81_12127 [Grifola frondosa]